MPEHLNAAPLYAAAAPQIDRLYPALDRFGSQPGAQCSAAQQAAIDRLLRQDDQVLTLLRRASRLPHCRFAIDYGHAPWYDDGSRTTLRHACLVLGYQAMSRARRGDAAGAYDAIATELRIANHLQGETLLGGQLAHWLCCRLAAAHLSLVMATAPPSAGQMAALWPLLDGRSLAGTAVRAAVGERAELVTFWQFCRRDPTCFEYLFPDGGLRLPRPLQQPAMRLAGPLVDVNLASLIDTASQVIELQRLPGPRFYPAARRLESWGTRAPAHLFMAAGYTPMLTVSRHCADEAAARCVMARWALALSLYHHQHGRYPAALTAARAVAPSTPGNDPFTGRLPLYKPTARGYALYCLGPNGRDDGGKTARYGQGTADDVPWFFRPKAASPALPLRRL